MTRQEQIENAANTYYSETWDEHGGIAMVVDNNHDVWFPSCATDDFFKAGAEWADEHPDLYSVTRKSVEREREYLIRAACDWLRASTILAETTIERFKKAMEEQE